MAIDYNVQLNSIVSNLTVAASPLAGRCLGIQPGHDTSPRDSAAEAFPHVCRGTAALQVRQHNGRLFRGHPPKSHPEDIRRQGQWHHRWPPSESRRVCSYSAEEVLTLFHMSYSVHLDIRLVLDSKVTLDCAWWCFFFFPLSD